MTNNLRIWNALCHTDPKHTKPFSRAGGFRGTATKPIWQIMRLTEHFGPCGTGWGMGKPEFQTVAAGDDILVFCTVSLWYGDKDGHSHVYGVGGDKVMSKNKNGPYTNDEAFKASYTDALSNAMKQIGVSADIHMGQFEDQKYLREVEREFNAAGNAQTTSLVQAHAEIAEQTGNSKSTYQLSKERKEIAAIVATAQTAISMAQTRAELKVWLKENRPTLEEKLPTADFEALIASVDAKWDDLPAALAA